MLTTTATIAFSTYVFLKWYEWEALTDENVSSPKEGIIEKHGASME